MRKSFKKKFQSEFKKRLLRSKAVAPFELPDFIKATRNCSKEVLESALGNVGIRFFDLFCQIDLDHPDIVSLFCEKFKDYQKFSIEFIESAKASQGKNLSGAELRVKKTIANDLEEIIEVVEQRSKNRVNLRFLKDEKERAEIRLQKRMQTIDLRSLYKKGRNYWDSLSDDFFKFIRFDDAYNDDLALAEKKSRQYKELGCTFLATEIEKTIVVYKSNMDQSYFGFNRITITNAAAILAKFSGYQLQSFCNNWNSFDKEYFAAVEKDKFKGDLKQFLDNDFSFIDLPTKENFYFYEPRIYPFHYFQNFASENVKKIVSFLDNFPEANGKPIFDHFGVIVSGVKYLENKNEKLNFSLDYENLTFEKNDALNFWLDKTFLQKKYFNAIIVAEKDGKTYFICFF